MSPFLSFVQPNTISSTMNLHTYAIVYVALLVFALSFTRFHVSEASGFTIDLIHRDSLQSPSVKSVLIPSERVTNAINRSLNYVKTLTHDHDYPQLTSADIIPDRGEYLMKFSLGAPPVEMLAIADTGSDLTWIQCSPCIQCFSQKAPLFDPSRSSTYKPIPCTSTSCAALSRTHCSNGTCGYSMSYGDRSYSQGDLAKETIALGSTPSEKATFPNVIIGCGHMDQGTFDAGTSGIVGLGGGIMSLTTQMGSSIRGKFSYCLVPLGTTKQSKISFGDNAVVSGPGVVSTPMVRKSIQTFYYLTLEGFSVGNQRLEFSSRSDSSSLLAQEGNIIIDSGTTLTILPIEFYNQVVTAVKSQVKGRIIADPQRLLGLCYLTTGSDVQVPEIIAHFKGGDVKLKPVNTFVRTSQNSLCLAFAPATSIAIYGNLAQMDFLVGYDLVKKTVSFKPTDCSQA